jgi:hypothetical protein
VHRPEPPPEVQGLPNDFNMMDLATATVDLTMSDATVVEPPSDVMTVIDRTAWYIACPELDGGDFEYRLLTEKAPKFSFLQLNSIFRPYYDRMLSQFKQVHAARTSGSVPTDPNLAKSTALADRFIATREAQNKAKSAASVSALIRGNASASKASASTAPPMPPSFHQPATATLSPAMSPTSPA